MDVCWGHEHRSARQTEETVRAGSLKLTRHQPMYYAALQPDKGKPLERVGRKATGLRPAGAG
jgi:hypothetical protein